MIARFSAKQNPVTTNVDGSTVYFQIALNEREVIVKDESGTRTEYEYDFNSFYCDENEIDAQDVLENPDLYLDYPYPAPTQTERIDALEAAVLSLMEV